MSIAYVQSVTATTGNSSTFGNDSLPITITPAAAGNVLVLALGARASTNPPSITVTASDGTAFTQVIIGGYMQMFIGVAATGGSPITVTASSASTNSTAVLSEYSGAKGTPGASASRGTGNVKGATLSITTTAANSWLVWGMNNSNTGTALVPAGSASRGYLDPGGLSTTNVTSNGCDSAASVGASGSAASFGWTSASFTDGSLAGFELLAASGPASVTGTSAATMPPLGSSATATVATSGPAVSTLPALNSAGAGSLGLTGTSAAALPALTADGGGQVGSAVTGASAATLPALASAAAGTVQSPSAWSVYRAGAFTPAVVSVYRSGVWQPA